MNLHTAYLCLGSNSDAYARLEKARALLGVAFCDILQAGVTFHHFSPDDVPFQYIDVPAFREDVTFHPTPDAPFQCIRPDADRTFHTVSPNDDDAAFHRTVPQAGAAFYRTTPDVAFRDTVPQADGTFHTLTPDDAPFQGIIFSTPTETEAVGEGWLSPFVNQVARLHTTLSAEEIRAICKEIERKCGRTEGEKAEGRMSMDVDLLTFDDVVLKPKDMQRKYILQGIKELE